MAKKRSKASKTTDTKPAVEGKSESADRTEEAPPTNKRLLVLSLLALGVVFGDIGTSPLYAIRVCFHGEYGVPMTGENVLGVLSLIFWSLIWVISVKYLIFIMRADNDGEGGIIALIAILLPKGNERRRTHWLLVFLGLFGGALLFGDGMITPAISVLSAVEGLEIAAPVFSSYVVPMTIVLLAGLFLLQRKGTAGVGSLFGPVILSWFVVLMVLGVHGILRAPQVLAGLNPTHAIHFFIANKLYGFLTLGTVFLVVTGGEALYADMGHFGPRPIRFAWFTVVLPGLLFNYFGQGAVLLTNPDAVRNPFFLLAPGWALIPLVILSTAATIIASQAVISGSFSMAGQLVQLGFSPRVDIRHTSEEEVGQIYVPSVNWMLMLCTIGLVLGFETSDNLAAAYGVAVTTTMVITSIIFYFVCRERWHWPLWSSMLLSGSFLVADLAFFGANIIKVEYGGWFPLLVGFLIFILMSTWKRGREILASRLSEGTIPVEDFLKQIKKDGPQRVPGTAVYMTSQPEIAPYSLMHNLGHNHVLHERVILLTVVIEDTPRVPSARRLDLEDLGNGIYQLIGRYGFMDTVNVPRLLTTAKGRGFEYSLDETTFVLGRETLLPTKRPGMAIWREWLFAVLSRNAQTAASYFKIPAGRVLEIGVEVEL